MTAARRENDRAARRNLPRIALVALIPGALLSFALIVIELGPAALLTGSLLAVLPVPLYLALALQVDRYEREPWEMLAWAFAWGALGASTIALIVNSLGELIVSAAWGPVFGKIYGGSVSAPIVEEGSKAAALFFLYRTRRNEFNGIADGVVYAAMVALGFAMTENILYYGRAALEGNTAQTFVMRGVLTPFLHPLFTSLTGIGFGIASQSTRRSVRIWAPALGLAGAMAAHSLWNTAAFESGLHGAHLLIDAFVVFALVLVGILVIVWYTAKREGQVVRKYLERDVNGVVTQGDLNMLGSLKARRAALRTAKRLGSHVQKTLKAFQQTATELAFLRYRVENQLEAPQKVPEDEQNYMEALRGLKKALPAALGGGALETAATAHPAGWYPDPQGGTTLRYWDGSKWTWHTSGAPAVEAAPA